MAPGKKKTAKKKAAAKKAASGRLLEPAARETVLDTLRRTYRDARCSLDHTSPLQLLVATILSAQCTDERVNMVTRDLFRKYVEPRDYSAAPPGALEEDIRSTGFYRNKARAIRGACALIDERFGGEVPGSMDELLSLPGVARKTASVVLGNAFGKAEGIVVDTHVARISQRLGLTRNTRPDKIEKDLMKIVPHNRWIAFSHQMIQHGRNVCSARKPVCARCPFETVCPSRGDFAP